MCRRDPKQLLATGHAVEIQTRGDTPRPPMGWRPWGRPWGFPFSLLLPNNIRNLRLKVTGRALDSAHNNYVRAPVVALLWPGSADGPGLMGHSPATTA